MSGFLHFKEFELYRGAVFLKIYSPISMIFEVKLEKWFLVTPKQEVEQKRVLRREFFPLQFNYRMNKEAR